MTEKEQGTPAEQQDMPGATERSGMSRGGRQWALLALVLAGVAVVGISILDKGGSDKLIKREAEEFELRQARTPTPPAQEAPRPERPRGERADKGDTERERRMEELALRLAQAEQAAQLKAAEKEREVARQAEIDRAKELDKRRRSPILMARTQVDEPGTSQPAGSSVDPFQNAARLVGDLKTTLASGQKENQSPAPPYGFLPKVDAARPETVAAGFFGTPGLRINQGKLIHGTLETAIQSDLPGTVRAVVSADVYAEDGSRVLIPAGSRLVGEYRSGVVRGQSRVAVVWHRIARPDGVDVVISAPGTDALGVAGLAGDVDTHFWERFGGAVLLSLIDLAADREDRDEVALVGENGRDAASIALETNINIPPTIHVDQGARINVFVQQDLDFSGSPQWM